MKILYILAFAIASLFAVSADDVRNWDQIGQYNRICQESVRNLFIEEQSEALANMYAKACLSLFDHNFSKKDALFSALRRRRHKLYKNA